MKDQSSPSRFRFNIRTLLEVTTLVAVLLAASSLTGLAAALALSVLALALIFRLGTVAMWAFGVALIASEFTMPETFWGRANPSAAILPTMFIAGMLVIYARVRRYIFEEWKQDATPRTYEEWKAARNLPGDSSS